MGVFWGGSTDVLFFDIETIVDSERFELFDADLDVKARRAVQADFVANPESIEDFEASLIEKRGLLAAMTPEYWKVSA